MFIGDLIAFMGMMLLANMQTCTIRVKAAKPIRMSSPLFQRLPCSNLPLKRVSRLHISIGQLPSANAPIETRADRVLQALPLPDLVRTLSVLTVASLPSPILSFVIGVIRRHSGWISTLPILSWPLRRTFYDTFCIGEEKHEIDGHVSKLRSRGLSGVVLSFAREAKLGEAHEVNQFEANDLQLRSWVGSNLETIARVSEKDYIAVKMTGAGSVAVKVLEEFSASHPSTLVLSSGATKKNHGMDIMKAALFEICAFGREKGVRVMVDAESTHHQPAIDELTLVQLDAA